MYIGMERKECLYICVGVELLELLAILGMDKCTEKWTCLDNLSLISWTSYRLSWADFEVWKGVHSCLEVFGVD
jgi:hypothetical protein